ncbi:MAG: hypothetical protein ABI114_10695 [Rhodanobacter sp.]
MAGKTTRPVPTVMGTDGVPVARTITSPTDNTTRAQCKVPPHTVVPIVFVPGIMGSNLRDKDTHKNIWGLNSKIGMLFQWGFRSSGTRQSKLNPDKAEVDPNGGFPGKSATVPDAETAKQRGWGTVAKMSYGGFLRWLDDSLNADLCGSAVPGEDKSPWTDFEGRNAIGVEWGAEKTFEPITPEESNHAWIHFYCPVYAAGYNWLKSNGDSGKDLVHGAVDKDGLVLVKGIDQIIQYWNDFETTGGFKPYRCEQVILVSHSMGGLATRAAVHGKFGNANGKVLGIVHGEQPANGAAAAYHHCRSGYGGMTGIVLGRNAAQVTAVFANSPGAMELLPNQQYPKHWLKARAAGSSTAVMQLPESDPYIEIYTKLEPWWRLVDPKLIDPSGTSKKSGAKPSDGYIKRIRDVGTFHGTLGASYHPQTYVHYGYATDKCSVWGDLIWESASASAPDPIALLVATPDAGSNPVTVQGTKFHIVDPQAMGYPQPGDGTVPACSGQAPNAQGGSSIQQSFKMTQGFQHQDAYNDPQARLATLWCIGKLLQQAKAL